MVTVKVSYGLTVLRNCNMATNRDQIYPKLFLLVTLVLVISGQVFGFYPFTLQNYMMVGQVSSKLTV